MTAGAVADEAALVKMGVEAMPDGVGAAAAAPQVAHEGIVTGAVWVTMGVTTMT